MGFALDNISFKTTCVYPFSSQVAFLSTVPWQYSTGSLVTTLTPGMIA